MNTEHLKICVAGINIEFQTSYRFSKSFFRHFLSEGQTDCKVVISEEDITIHEQYSGSEQETWEGGIKSSNLLKKVSDCLIDYDIVLMHSAAIALNNNAFAFMAPSGTGKTTHILKWLENISDAFVINGDKPFIKISDDDFPPFVCGSPWAGKEKMYTNTIVRLKAIICLERAEYNSIRQISFAEAVPFVLQQTYRPTDEEKMRRTIKLLKRLNGKVLFYRFQCNNFKDDCFKVAYNALVECT